MSQQPDALYDVYLTSAMDPIIAPQETNENDVYEFAGSRMSEMSINDDRYESSVHVESPRRDSLLGAEIRLRYTMTDIRSTLQDESSVIEAQMTSYTNS